MKRRGWLRRNSLISRSIPQYPELGSVTVKGETKNRRIGGKVGYHRGQGSMFSWNETTDDYYQRVLTKLFPSNRHAINNSYC